MIGSQLVFNNQSSSSTMKADPSNSHTVSVRPKAFVSMVLHATKHKTTSVHGVLLGSITGGNITVDDAVPISHGAPTKPEVEIALGLLPDTSNIVGWYTAPELLEDTRAGPVALRMVASLDHAGDKKEPTLIVLDNAALALSLKGQGKPDAAVQAYGKDFGGQWLDPLKVSLEISSNATLAAQEGFKQGVEINDWVDHLEGPASTPWYPNKDLNLLVDKFCKSSAV
jgi:hypothetical protein